MGRAARITPHPACPQASGHTPVLELPALAVSHILTQLRCGPVHLWVGGGSQPPPPQPAPADKDSCHKVGHWCPAFLLTSTLGELLCLWQDPISAGAFAVRQEPRARIKAFMYPVQVRSVLESPTCTQGTVFFSGQVPATTGHGAGRRVLEPSWGWQGLHSRGVSAGKRAGNKGNPPQQCGFNRSWEATGPQGANAP